MTILPIRTVPDPVLKSTAAPVADKRFGAAGLRELIDNMIETMNDVEGVGLAGPQVGVDLRVFVYNLDGRQGHVINPSLTVSGEKVSDINEGCLSVPDLYYAPARYERAQVTGFDVDGNPVTVEGEGLFARMLQHETDHLDGLLFIDRLEGQDKRAARRAMAGSSFTSGVQQVTQKRAASTTSAFSAFGRVK